MTIQFACPTCKKTLNASEDKAGLKLKCPGCKNPIQVPNAVPDSSPQPSPTASIVAALPPEAIPVSATTPPKNRADIRSAVRKFQGMSTLAKIAIAGGGVCLAFFFLCCGGISLMMIVGGKGDGAFGLSGASNTPAIKMIASQLFEEYKENQVAADERYKGKKLELSGTVDSIGKDFLGTIYVTMSGGGQFEIFRVQCYFDDKYKKEAASLSKGQQITIRGRCEGMLGNVMVKKCEFVQ